MDKTKKSKAILVVDDTPANLRLLAGICGKGIQAERNQKIIGGIFE